jgi:hypothetical protein
MKNEILIALEPPRHRDFIKVSKTEKGVYIELPPNPGSVDPVTVKLTEYLAGWLSLALEEIVLEEDRKEVVGAN